MKEFILVMTMLMNGAQPTTVEQRFSTHEDCESARVAVLKNAALVSAKLRRQREQHGMRYQIPQTVAVCTKASN